jgi:hypothetical protein
MRELRRLERELEADFRKCSGKLNHRRGRAPGPCPVLEEAKQAEIRSVPISSEDQAKALLFPGSPTIRVNGKDVEPGKTSAPGLACRLYADRSGVPSEEVLRLAIKGEARGVRFGWR